MSTETDRAPPQRDAAAAAGQHRACARRGYLGYLVFSSRKETDETDRPADTDQTETREKRPARPHAEERREHARANTEATL